MKRLLLATAGILLMFQIAPAQAVSGRPYAPAVQHSQEPARDTNKTFTGIVMKQGDLYVLSDKADKTNYQLDDVKQASEYEGKNVKVMGTLDAANLTIHVQSIVEIT